VTIRAQNLSSGTIGSAGWKSDARFLEPVDSKFMIETDPSIFERAGYTKYYEEVSGAGINGQKQLYFYPIPLTETEILIMGKGVCPGLIADTDSSVIRNLDAVLIATPQELHAEMVIEERAKKRGRSGAW
jgi:hypothetical protein